MSELRSEVHTNLRPQEESFWRADFAGIASECSMSVGSKTSWAVAAQFQVQRERSKR